MVRGTSLELQGREGKKSSFIYLNLDVGTEGTRVVVWIRVFYIG